MTAWEAEARRTRGDRTTSPLLQVETGRSLLPDRRQKRKLHVTSCSWKTKLGILQTEKTTCLHFVPLFVAQRATGQRRPLLQVETGRSMLPDRRQKRKLHVTSCSWKTKLGTLQTEKNYLLAFLTFVCGAEGDRATSPSSASGNGSIYASRSSPEAQIARYFLQLDDEVGHFTNGKKTTCLHFLPLFVAQRATGQRRPLLQVETGRSMLPDRRQKRKLHVTSCSWKTKLGILHTEKKLPACAFYLCSWRRGRRGNVALFYSWKRSD